jgi:hypothetical protein
MTYSTQQSTDMKPVNPIHVGTMLLSATSTTGDEVCNMHDENLGKIQDLMINTKD